MEKKTLDQHHQAAGHTGIEPDNLPVKSISLFVAALVAIVVVTFVVMKQLYWFSATHLVQSTELDVPNKLLSTIRATDQEELSNYAQIDAQKGVYRLPIEEAMKMYVQKNAQ